VHLSELKISGYKVFKDEFTIKLNTGLTVLIGENGCGKTTIIDAIRLLLNEDEFGRVGIRDAHLDATDNTIAYLNRKIDNKQNNRGRFDHKIWGGESLASIFEWELIG